MGGDERPTGSTGGWAATGDPDQPTYRPGSARPVYPQQPSDIPAQSGNTSAFPAGPGGYVNGGYPTGHYPPPHNQTSQYRSPYAPPQSDSPLPVTAVPFPRPPRWNGPTGAQPGVGIPPWGTPYQAAGQPPWSGPPQWGPHTWAPAPPPPKRRPVGLIAFIVVLLLLAPFGGWAFVYMVVDGRGQPANVSSGTNPTGPAMPLGPPQVDPSAAGGVPNPTGTGAAPGNPAVDGNAIAKIVNPAIVDVNTVLGFQNARAAGTGILLNSTGLVLTNNHVIAGATDIKAVSIGNGRTYPASVVGYDRSHDVAVIQLGGASGLTHITLGDSSKVHVNDPIVAIGNAGGVGGKPAVVTGSVTALNQSITATDEDGTNPRRLSGLIQIAADIRAGDSGGPLVDKSAHLIGMDTAAAVDSSGQSAGTGYAIPVNAAMSIAKQIEAGNASSTVHIGQTAMLGVSASDAKGNNPGAQITDFLSGGNARQSGLQIGDIITSADGHDIASASDLTDIINIHHPGDQIKLQWIDGNGQSRSGTVSLSVGPAA